MSLSPTDARCVGRSDLSPDSVTCPKRDECARYVELRDSPADKRWPAGVVFTQVCTDAALSEFVGVVHGSQCEPGACAGQSCGRGMGETTGHTVGGCTPEWGMA